MSHDQRVLVSPAEGIGIAGVGGGRWVGGWVGHAGGDYCRLQRV